MLSAVGLIPARYESSRLPGKPLVDLQGKPLLYHVYKRALRAQSLSRVLIATDDERIYNAARDFGAEVVMTERAHRSGTDRIAEAVRTLDADIVVNIQGDEPFIEFQAINRVVELLQEDPAADMSTLIAPVRAVEELVNPNVVKVVADERGYAVYFSRSPIPYARVKGLPYAQIFELAQRDPDLLKHFYRHIGLYAYRKDFLMLFTKWAPSPLEVLEDLEQLRAIDHGVRIKLGVTGMQVHGVDTPEDMERIRKLVEGNPQLLEA